MGRKGTNELISGEKPFIAILSNLKCLFIVRQRRGVTLHESTHNGFLQIMHPRTFLIKNPSDAKLASLSVFRKWPVSMATIAKIGNY